jgi:ankyrin repeat protein
LNQEDDCVLNEQKLLILEEWINCVKNNEFDKMTEIKDTTNINNHDKFGKTALMYSIQQRKIRFTQYLIDKGANINLGGQVKSVMLFGRLFVPDRRFEPSRSDENEKLYEEKDIILSDLEYIKYKIAGSKSTDYKPFTRKCRYGVYPIMYAIENCDIQTIELLIDNKADLLVVDGEGIDVMGYVYKCQGLAQKDMRDLIKPLFDEARKSSRKSPKQKLLEQIAKSLENIKDDDTTEQVRALTEVVGSLSMMSTGRKPT